MNDDENIVPSVQNDDGSVLPPVQNVNIDVEENIVPAAQNGALPEEVVEVPSDVPANVDFTSGAAIPANWIEIKDGKFECSECANIVHPETNTVEGTVEADLTQIKTDLEQFPNKIIYGICPICGMEFVFKNRDSKLYLEPSEMVK